MVFIVPRLGIVKLSILLNNIEIMVDNVMDVKATITISNNVFLEQRRKEKKERKLILITNQRSYF